MLNLHLKQDFVFDSMDEDEAEKLVETGFEYICKYNDVLLFRKRK